MTNFDIRRLEGDEKLETLHLPLNYAFSSSPPLRDRDQWIERMKYHADSITCAITEHDRVMAVAAGAPMTINVRGVIWPMSGLWGVVVMPEARRKGYATKVIHAVLEEAYKEDVALACLYAFRESFYERLGYVSWPQGRTATFKTAPLAPILKWDHEGSVEMMSIKDGYDIYRAFLLQQQKHTHGMALFSEEASVGMRERDKYWLAVARDGCGDVVGVMIYSIDNSKQLMKVQRFYANGIRARYLLLDYMARHIDQVLEVEVPLPPGSQPNTWIADIYAKQSAVEPPMGRVLNVAGLDGIPVGEGAFTVNLSDPFCTWNEGVWRFESVGGELRVSPAERADCALTMQALSALVWGVRDPAEFEIRGWGDPPQSVQLAMQSMFPRTQPWHHSEY